MYKLIYNFGQYLRNPSIKRWLAFLKKSDQWSKEALEKYQVEQLQKIVELAYNHSPFYRKFWDQHQFHPSQIKSIKDIEKIPIVEKQTLLANVSEIHTQLNFKKVFTATTSGSTGDALKFKRDEAADSFNRAAILRGYSWYSVNPWEYSGYFWGFNFTFFERLKVRFLDLLQNRFRIFSYHKATFNKFVKKLQQAKYISGYSSMLYDTAKLINEQRFEKPKHLKLVVGTSEKILEAYQEESIKAYGHKIISEYGATEAGIMAFECPSGNMHVTMEGVVLEEVNEEILVTNLVMQSFPIIRYRLGDYIKLAPEDFQCNCGRKHRVLLEVTGRVGALIYGYKQQYPSLYGYYIFKNLTTKHHLVLNYQAVQESKGTLKLFIEQHLNERSKELIMKECANYFKNDLSIEIIDKFVSAERTQKMNAFKSNLINEA